MGWGCNKRVRRYGGKVGVSGCIRRKRLIAKKAREIQEDLTQGADPNPLEAGSVHPEKKAFLLMEILLVKRECRFWWSVYTVTGSTSPGRYRFHSLNAFIMASNSLS